MSIFKLSAEYEPQGDQPEAIKKLTKAFKSGEKFQTLMGVTGSGKTFTMANVIKALGKPTLVMSHNKTLAAQLYSEFKEFFPENAVGYFVSYYDYYQPEAYIPQRDIYIEKEATINQEIGPPSPGGNKRPYVTEGRDNCCECLMYLRPGFAGRVSGDVCASEKGQEIERNALLLKLVNILYERSDIKFERGVFRVQGDVIDVFPAYEKFAYRIELFGDEIDRLSIIDPLNGDRLRELEEISIYPAKHFVMPEGRIEGVIESIERELDAWLKELRSQNKDFEAQRLEARTRYDMEMLSEIGYCHGIENYSRHISGRAPGERPYSLFDYFPDEFFLIVDESHVAVPQIRGMYAGDRSRKETLVKYGFRLPSALDNRPLRFDEWESMIDQVLFVSATPSEYEINKCNGKGG